MPNRVMEFRSAVGLLLLASAFAFKSLDSAGMHAGRLDLIGWAIGCAAAAGLFFLAAARAGSNGPDEYRGEPS